MGKNIALGASFIIFLLLFFSQPTFAQTNPEEGILDDLTGPQCCVCLNVECCFLIPEEGCDEQGNLINPEFLEAFFAQLDIQGGEICKLCDQCQLNTLSPEEQEQFLNVCDICVFEPILEQGQCSLIPPDVVDIVVPPGNCKMSLRSGPINAMALLVGVLFLGILSWRKRRALNTKI